jgi:hypothetical protein
MIPLTASFALHFLALFILLFRESITDKLEPVVLPNTSRQNTDFSRDRESKNLEHSCSHGDLGPRR